MAPSNINLYVLTFQLISHHPAKERSSLKNYTKQVKDLNLNIRPYHDRISRNKENWSTLIKVIIKYL